MTRQDIEALLALATRATYSRENAFIAACSPEVIAALCRRALEADVAELKVRLLERTAKRNALCPDHRDKGTGDECIVCKFERSVTREAANGVRRQAFDEALRVLGKTLTAVSDAYDALEAARDRAPEGQ